MKATSRLLTLLLALVLVFTLVPSAARAEETAPQPGINTAEIPIRVNPLYEGIYEPDPEDIPQYPEPEEYSTHAVTYQTVEAAAATVRTNMKNRVESYNVYVRSDSADYNALYFELLNGAVMHTGVGNEGDYLMWHLATYGSKVSWEIDNGYYNYTYTFAMTYYTTADQEKQMDTAVMNLINSLGVKNKSDYEKVCAVYDWICANVTYDYEHVEDSSYGLMFSAYAALVNKTAVCQGYAQLFYRLMLELGVDVRFIGGDGGGPHAWNIVQLGDYYYNVDSTWDAGYGGDYYFFLKSSWTFGNHYRDPEFDTWEFHMAHPMAAEDYVHGGTATLDPYINMGYCGADITNAIWIMMRDGTLYIEGEGALYDYSTEEIPYWYYWLDHIEQVEIAEGVTAVGTYCFYEAPALQKVSLPEGLLSIGSHAFYRCSELTSINLPSTLTSLGESAFYACSKLEKIEFPAALAKIPYRAFCNCSGLTEIVFNEGLTEIDTGAFEGCSSLAELALPNSLETISMDAFRNCNALTEVTIPENVENVSGFQDCDGLITAYIKGTGSIGSYAFYSCDKLENLVIGDKITGISSSAFQYCRALKELTIPANVVHVAGFSDCSGLETLVLHNTGRIENYAFTGCSSLKNLTITSATSIGHMAFQSAQITAVEIPATVEEIVYGAFGYNADLKEIYFRGDAPEISSEAFYGVTADAYYPANNASWTEDKFQNYSGTLTWIPYQNGCAEHAYESVVTEPTCTEQGYTTYTCSVCGDSYVDNYTDPVDHVYVDGHCQWCGAGEQYVKFSTYTTSLGGNIAMNFYVELSKDLLEDPNAYMQFTFAGRTVKVPLSDGKEDVKNGVTVYMYACPITSKNMSDEITAQVVNASGNVGESKTMAVDTYCNWIIANYKDEKTINLMKAMLNYGASAQMLFNHNTDDLANAALSEEDKILTAVDASAYIHSRTGEEEGIKASSYTLLLDSETTVRCYFELTGDKTIDEFTFTVDGVEVEPQYKDGRYYIEKKNIAAHRLDDMHIFTCGGITITYGGLSYVNQVMTYYTEGTTFDMAVALYNYSQASEAYIA